MKKRLIFKCWNCHRQYPLDKELTMEQTMTIGCPFCHAEAVVDLRPYLKMRKRVLRGDSPDKGGEQVVWELPDVLPTQPVPPV